jgi:hypothetical protein
VSSIGRSALRRHVLKPTVRTSYRESVKIAGAMPSLIRLIVVLALIAGAVYGGMFALVMLVEPSPREMTIRVPPERLQP